MTLYTMSSLADKIGATPREIDYWTRSGYIPTTPVVGENDMRNPGTGKTRIWDERDAEIALWFARLVQVGMKPGAVGDVAKCLATGGSAYLPGGIEIRRVPVSGGAS